MEHELKTLPEYFIEVLNGAKPFEVRKNDRNYKVGDILVLNEWDGKNYTMRILKKKISYILDNPQYCKKGYAILGFK